MWYTRMRCRVLELDQIQEHINKHGNIQGALQLVAKGVEI